MFVVDNDLIMVVEKEGDYTLERLVTELGSSDFYLDRVFELETLPVDKRTITLPYADSSEDFVIVATQDDGNYRLNLEYSRVNPTTLLLDYDLRDNIVDVKVGKLYESTYTFKQFFIKDAATGVGVLEGRLQILNVKVRTEQADGFSAYVYNNTSQAIEPYITQYTGAIVGVIKVNELPISNASIRVSVLGESTKTDIKLVQKGVLACRFDSASYEANYTTRSRNI
jgi:hypothetical protein